MKRWICQTNRCDWWDTRRRALNLVVGDDTELERLPQSSSLLFLLFGWVLALLGQFCTAKLPRGWCPVAAVCLRSRGLLNSSQKTPTTNQN